MPLTVAEFSAAVARDEEARRRGEPVPGTATCACCGVPLGTETTGRHEVGPSAAPRDPGAARTAAGSRGEP